MSFKRKINWIISFSLLISFTFFGVSEVLFGRSAQVVLAQVIEASQYPEDARIVIFENGGGKNQRVS